MVISVVFIVSVYCCVFCIIVCAKLAYRFNVKMCLCNSMVDMEEL